MMNERCICPNYQYCLDNPGGTLERSLADPYDVNIGLASKDFIDEADAMCKGVSIVVNERKLSRDDVEFDQQSVRFPLDAITFHCRNVRSR